MSKGVAPCPHFENGKSNPSYHFGPPNSSTLPFFKHQNIEKFCIFLAHLSRRLIGELIVYPCSGVRPSSVVRPSSTISNMNISVTSGPITMKFYQKQYWDGGKAALGFGPDRIQTLVSMATNSSHRVIMEKTVLPLFLSCSSSDPFYFCR